MDSTQIGVLKETHQIRLCRLLESKHGVALWNRRAVSARLLHSSDFPTRKGINSPIEYLSSLSGYSSLPSLGRAWAKCQGPLLPSTSTSGHSTNSVGGDSTGTPSKESSPSRRKHVKLQRLAPARRPIWRASAAAKLDPGSLACCHTRGLPAGPPVDSPLHQYCQRWGGTGARRGGAGPGEGGIPVPTPFPEAHFGAKTFRPRSLRIPVPHWAPASRNCTEHLNRHVGFWEAAVSTMRVATSLVAVARGTAGGARVAVAHSHVTPPPGGRQDPGFPSGEKFPPSLPRSGRIPAGICSMAAALYSGDQRVWPNQSPKQLTKKTYMSPRPDSTSLHPPNSLNTTADPPLKVAALTQVVFLPAMRKTGSELDETQRGLVEEVEEVGIELGWSDGAGGEEKRKRIGLEPVEQYLSTRIDPSRSPPPIIRMATVKNMHAGTAARGRSFRLHSDVVSVAPSAIRDHDFEVAWSTAYTLDKALDIEKKEGWSLQAEAGQQKKIETPWPCRAAHASVIQGVRRGPDDLARGASFPQHGRATEHKRCDGT
nr:unnamed protein product [Digitaria exilis]